MRVLALAALAIGAISAGAPAQAQTYDPSYPVCLHVWGRGASYYECRSMLGQSVLRKCISRAVGPPI
jgi:hypothetical protein